VAPSYDYRCVSCDIIVEVQHGMKESPVILCACCDQPMTRVISGGAGIIWKGTGWYVRTASKDKRYREGQK
jgi:putative FmdB family regulatory protein